jgi:hypothetical protein
MFREVFDTRHLLGSPREVPRWPIILQVESSIMGARLGRRRGPVDGHRVSGPQDFCKRSETLDLDRLRRCSAAAARVHEFLTLHCFYIRTVNPDMLKSRPSSLRPILVRQTCIFRA